MDEFKNITNLTNLSSIDVNNIDKRIRSINNNSMVITFRVLALVFTLGNIVILFRIRKNNSLNMFMLIVGIVDALYTFFVLFLLMFVRFCANDPERCGNTGYLLFLVLFILISEYLTTGLQVFNIILEIFLTFQRLALISNFKWFPKEVNVKLVCCSLMSLCLILYSPILFMYNIQVEFHSHGNVTKVIHKLSKTSFGRSYLAMSILSALSAIRISLVSVVLLILNLITVIRFKAYLRKKLKITNLNCKIQFTEFLIQIHYFLIISKFVKSS
jgi:hypothetical protein